MQTITLNNLTRELRSYKVKYCVPGNIRGACQIALGFIARGKTADPAFARILFGIKSNLEGWRGRKSSQAIDNAFAETA